MFITVMKETIAGYFRAVATVKTAKARLTAMRNVKMLDTRQTIAECE